MCCKATEDRTTELKETWARNDTWKWHNHAKVQREKIARQVRRERERERDGERCANERERRGAHTLTKNNFFFFFFFCSDGDGVCDGIQ